MQQRNGVWGHRALVCGAMALLFSGTAAVRAQDGSDSAALPPDIDPVSLSRLPALGRDQLDSDGQAAYDLVVGDGAPPRTGPAAVSLYSPKVAEAFHLLNNYLRREGVLAARDYEVGIMVAAWEFNQQYEYSAHEPAAERLGTPQAVIDAIRYDRPTAGLPAKDALIIDFARALIREHHVSPELYRRVVAEFGEQGMVELATIIGDYVMVGFVLTAANQHLPPDRPARLPAR